MGGFFKTNCRSDWPPHYCDLGNIFAIFQTLIGFTAILPQIHQIWNYRSVEALSVLWPSALFSASITQAFYIFATDDRAFFKVIAIYYPIVYFAFLSSFWFFSTRHPVVKLSFVAGSIILWACIFTVEISVTFPDGALRLQWYSVVVYSVTVLPQLMLNIRLRTSAGQSSISVMLLIMVATFAFLRSYLLIHPVEYRLMYYLNTCLIYINGVQIVWYPKPLTLKQTPRTYGILLNSKDYSGRPDDPESVMMTTASINGLPNTALVDAPTELAKADTGSNFSTSQSMKADEFMNDESKLVATSSSSAGTSLVGSQTVNVPGYFRHLREKSLWQIILFLYLLVGVVLFTVATGFDMSTSWIVAAPIAMFSVCFLTALYRDYKEGTLRPSEFAYYLQRKFFGSEFNYYAY